MAATVLMLVVGVAPAAGQEGAPAPAAPAPAEAMAIYQGVEAWVRSWDPATDAELPAVAAASVTLRFGGLVIGRGTDASGERSVAKAYDEAFREGRERIPVTRDALWEQAEAELASQVVVSLELAGPLVPFEPAEYADATAAVAPGLEGVAVRVRGRVEAMFPSAIVASGIDAGRALGVLVAKASGDPLLGLRSPRELRREHGAAFYRFRVAHLAQPAPVQPPIFLHRGGRIVAKREMDISGLRAFADALAAHLERRCVAAGPDGVMAGTLQPVQGVFEPAEASASDAALGIIALVRYSQLEGVAEERRAAAREAAAGALRSLASSREVLTAEGADPVTAAAVFLAVHEWAGAEPGRDAELEALHGGLRTWLLYEPEGENGERSLRQWPEGAWSSPVAGLMAAALAEAANREDEAEVAHARRALRAVYRSTPAGLVVGQMPWLGWAELSLAEGADAVPAAAALHEARDLTWRHQLGPGMLPAESLDLAGGIVFTKGANPLPSWHSARPLAFAATMLGDIRLTAPDERAEQTTRVVEGLRFLRQLTVDGASAYLCADRELAMGGVRSAPWDLRMPVDATAMTLLAVTETLASVGRIEERQKGP